MSILFQVGEIFTWSNDKEPGVKQFSITLKMIKEIYQNGRKQGMQAEDIHTGKKYFIKVLACDTFRDVYIEKESKVKLYSPFIIRIYGGMLDKENKRFITLIEYIDEYDLSDLIRHHIINKHYSKKETLDIKYLIVLKILYGIEYYVSLYEEDPIVHRDIKPENIMASKDGNITKIIDFDWVHLHESNVTIMARREQKGTPGYAEPKSWNRYSCNKQMDIYSTGLLMYFIFMEQHHFYGQEEITRYLQADEYAYRLKDTKNMDQRLRRIIQKMIAREEERYQSIEEVIRDYTEYLKSINCLPEIKELLNVQEDENKIRLSYRFGAIKYSPVLKNYRFVSIKYGIKQMRSKNGTKSGHILSFYRINDKLKVVVINPKCYNRKIHLESPTLEIGDVFEYEDTLIKIINIKEVDM